MEDLDAGALPQPPNPGREEIDALLAERKPDLVTADGWRAIDGHELERGRSEQRPRVKLASREELLRPAQRVPDATPGRLQPVRSPARTATASRLAGGASGQTQRGSYPHEGL